MIAPDCQARRLHLAVRPRLSELPKGRPPAFAKISTSLGDATQKLRVMFKTIVEPVVVRGKPDQDAGWPAVASDDDFFVGCQPEVFRQIILYLG
jgi:hypothetical protein